MTSVATIQVVSEDDSVDIFYKGKEGLPDKIKNTISNFNPIWLSNKLYLPVYIGFSDAKMMVKNKEFTKVGDIIGDFSGHSVIIAGVLPETKTLLDTMHFVETDFEIKK